ncbi:MAG: hypothetical protein ACRCZF_10855 [Gemmataceae bacterium]
MSSHATSQGKQYRAVDVELLHRMLDPIEGELRAMIEAKHPESTPEQLDEHFDNAMESLIFDTIDQHPEFSKLVDSLQSRLRLHHVSFTAP